ncbi:MAG: RNA-binding protein [Thermoproteota archaeon]
MSSSAVVIVGKKKPWNYVTACITAFNSGTKTLMIRGRGNNISRAVDVANLLRRNVAGVEILEIRIVEDPITVGGSGEVPVIEIIFKNPHSTEDLNQRK